MIDCFKNGIEGSTASWDIEFGDSNRILDMGEMTEADSVASEWYEYVIFLIGILNSH